MDEHDLEIMLNCRQWFEEAITAAGAKVIDGGIADSYCDVGVSLDGCDFSVRITPRPLASGAEATND